MASNDEFPTEAERHVIAKWATMREECDKRVPSTSNIPPGANPIQTAYLQQEQSFGRELFGRVSELIVAHYRAKLTYGEFAQKRYEIGRDTAAAERQFRAASLIADHDRQVQERQLAEQQFQNNLLAWSTYMQAVNARQPQTVHLQGTVNLQTNCTSQKIGTVVSTNCN